MPLVVNTNLGSLSAQRSLATSGTELKTAMERLSSGKKINTAADDAAGFAIAERMTAQIRGLNMATKNANDGLAMLAVIENATNDVTDMLQRMRELAVQAANDTNGSTDRSFLQEEVNSLISEVNRVANQTVYNNKVVLDGSLNGSIQVGTEAGQNVDFSIDSIKTDDLGGNKFVQAHRANISDASAVGTTVTLSVDSNVNLEVGDHINLISSDRSAGSFQITAVDGDAGTISIDAAWIADDSGDLTQFATDFSSGDVYEGEHQFQSISSIRPEYC